MKQILEDRADFVFFIKLLPLKIHPAAYKKSKVITCEKSIRLLERAFDGKTIPTEPRCETTEVDETIELAEKLNITGTPSVVLPDGAVVGGATEAEDLIDMIVKAGLAVPKMPKSPKRVKIPKRVINKT
jgi:thiol:disulfide interchange protein DsbC